MNNAACLYPEMVTAGIEAFAESERQELDIQQTVIAIWMAMEAVRQVSELPAATVH